MFGKLKEKLKSALSVFSRKAEEEAEVKEVVVEKMVEREKAIPKEKAVLKTAPVSSKPKSEAPKPGAEKEEKEKEPEQKKAEAKKSDATPEKIPPDELRITYFVHGTTVDNEHGIATGLVPGELSALGKQQCFDLKEKIKDKHFDAVFCSDLKRAVESAKITFGPHVIPDERLRECNYGDLNQKSEELHRQFEKGNDLINGGYPHGESLKQVEKRLRNFLNSIYPQYQGKRIAIVAHRAPQLALEAILQWKTWQQAIKEDWRLQTPPGWKPGWEFRMHGTVDEIPSAEELISQTIEEFAPGKKREARVEKPEAKAAAAVTLLPEKADEKKEEIPFTVQKLLEEVGEAEEAGIPVKEEATEPVHVAEKPLPTEKQSEKPSEKNETKRFFSKWRETFSKPKEVPVETEKAEQKKTAPSVPVAVTKEKPTKIIPEIHPKVPREESTEKSAEKKGFFEKIKQSITTKTISAEKFEELFWDLEITLLENNVSVEVIERIKEDLKRELVDKPLPRDVESKILDTLKNTLQDILTFEQIDVLTQARQKKPYVIAFFGINGAGKTTSIAKLVKYFREHQLSVVLAAGDTFRAAAIQQLEEHAQQLGVKIIKHDYGADAAAVAFDAIKYAEKNKIDVVLIDTAGRLHSNTNLMSELQKIIRVAKPDLKLFVGESITGNDCIEQAREFNQLVELDGVVLTKADVDEKGGAPLSIAYTIKKPILFMGIGQRYEDLEEFDAEKVLGRLGL